MMYNSRLSSLANIFFACFECKLCVLIALKASTGEHKRKDSGAQKQLIIAVIRITEWLQSEH